MASDDEVEWVSQSYWRALQHVRPLDELARPASAAAVRRALEQVRPHRMPGPASQDDLWDLYALHRLDALLRTAFQERRRPTRLARFALDLAAYTAYWTERGLDVVHASSFHPFFHEIVAVEPADDPDAPCEITSTVWPCLFWGRLLFARAGVRIRAGAHVIDPEIACDSTLYWEHLRVDRPCQDLSTGWGSNSQWRTAFRRDYLAGGRLLYNVDAARSRAPRPLLPGSATMATSSPHGSAAGASAVPEGLAPSARSFPDDQGEQLLRHRCSVRAPALDDAWPYHLHADEPLPADLVLDGLVADDD